MQRRQFLAASGIGLSALVAGCQRGDDPSDPRGNTPSGSSGSEPRDIGDEGSGVVVTDISVQKSVMDVDAFRILHTDPEGQYLVIETEGEPPEFVPVLDGEVVGPLDQVSPSGPNTAYALGVDVEAAAAAETGAIALQRNHDTRWQLPESTLERLGKRPEIRVLDTDVGERDGEAAFRVTLENVGDRDGVFRAIVASPVGADLDGDISVTVPMGETITETFQNNIITDWDLDHEFESVDPDQRFFEQSEHA